MVSDYRFSAAFAVRMMGLFLVLVGALVVLAAVLVAVLDVPVLVLSLALVAALVAVVGAGAVTVRRAAVVSLDEVGYRVRFVRGAGVTRARWKDVEDATATTVGGARCVVLRLRDGRTTTVPVGALAGRPDDFVRDLQQHLNRGHGYRPLR